MTHKVSFQQKQILQELPVKKNNTKAWKNKNFFCISFHSRLTFRFYVFAAKMLKKWHLVLQKAWFWKGQLGTLKSLEMISFCRPHTLFLTFSVYFFVSLPASSSLNHRLSRFLSQLSRDRRYIWSWLVLIEWWSWDIFIHFTARWKRSLLLWKVRADIMCSAYMLLCHLMPHRTDSECMRLLKIN